MIYICQSLSITNILNDNQYLILIFLGDIRRVILKYLVKVSSQTSHENDFSDYVNTFDFKII